MSPEILAQLPELRAQTVHMVELIDRTPGLDAVRAPDEPTGDEVRQSLVELVLWIDRALAQH